MNECMSGVSSATRHAGMGHDSLSATLLKVAVHLCIITFRMDQKAKPCKVDTDRGLWPRSVSGIQPNV